MQNQKTQESNHLLFERIERKRKIQVKNLSLLKTEEFVIPRAIKNAYKEISVLFGGKGVKYC